ncbi:hypothetical protein QFC19_003060 [Naganishia cerealis]|uniref:Uncharacterized protein n=1 Tax=Naganishia cerealis TaxID=610337 RepID=A0ACC2W4V2_9TREE|nr:hypothetical protein QFC19_003060 [Naganishia cerealis]
MNTYSAVPMEEYKIGVYDPQEYLYPSDTFVLLRIGEKPGTNRPGKDTPTLWQGSDNKASKTQATIASAVEDENFSWETEKIRLPVAAYIRPSTCDGYV